MNGFGIYFAGFFLLTIGVAGGLLLAGVPGPWIGVAAFILLGIGVMMGITKTKMKDPPAA